MTAAVEGNASAYSSATWRLRERHDDPLGRASRGGTSLTLLGSWALWDDGVQVTVTASEQRLLVLLALKGGQRRPYIAGTLWPDANEKQALRRLRNLLWNLRRRCPALLEATEDAVSLNASVVVDVQELVATARELIEGSTGTETLGQRLSIMSEPAELLLGCYDDWVLRERDRINELRIRALEALVDDLLLCGRHGDASVAAIAAIELDPLRESSHRALMRVYLVEGNPALAIRQMDRYREILRTELGTGEPTAKMLELVTQATDHRQPPLLTAL